MTTSPKAASHFDERSLVGISTSASAAVAVGLICTYLDSPPEVTGTLVAAAGGLPAAIEYSLRTRQRDVVDDISSVKKGELQRPVGLLVVMHTATVLLIEAACALMPLPRGLSLAGMVMLSASICAVLAFLVASRVAHYLGEHPYRWTAVAVTAAYLIEAIIFLALNLAFGDGNSGMPWSGWWRDVSFGFTYYLLALVGSLAGAWYAGRRHATFLRRKLQRMERRAGHRADQQISAVPTQSFAASGDDLLNRLTKLAEMRDDGVLTEAEFQAKKAEILARI
ncbi:SHOCT domain-containing protein [Mycolicibacterium mageritense]|uniref:SHOCT domain-containing protein n=1 Tax=Mycolicibacterium mageritense TaxID=53462 RepID=A0AAI8TU11_MYCME|nr:SHOCT domain-containing protein [Mycolicibacterium mageritense]BDY28949.1 hypothetical protein hbim_02885 [Mycolicibacterium mageritense]